MKRKRMIQTIRLCMQRGAVTRGKWLKKHHVFGGMGDNVRYQIRTVPLYPELIKIGSNVNISTGVLLVTHDAMNAMYNAIPDTKEPLMEKVSCIEIGDNVFIGANVMILGNVKVGSNVIVSAFSLVNKDLPDNGIYGGVPARKLGDFDEFWEKRSKEDFPTVKRNQFITEEEIRQAWGTFYRKRKED